MLRQLVGPNCVTGYRTEVRKCLVLLVLEPSCQEKGDSQKSWESGCLLRWAEAKEEIWFRLTVGKLDFFFKSQDFRNFFFTF